MSGDFMTGEVTVRWDDRRGAWQRRLFISRLTSGRDQTLALRPPRAVKVKESRVSEDAILQPRSDGGYDLTLQAHRKAAIEMKW